LHNLAWFLVKNANFFAEFFGENIFKIITSVPVLYLWCPKMSFIFSVLSMLSAVSTVKLPGSTQPSPLQQQQQSTTTVAR
jgi:hypothetical protein